VVFTQSPNVILYDAPWPYPFEQLPLVKFPGMRVPGQLWDSSVVEHAIPLQKELNRTLSQMVEYKNLTLKPQMLAPVGSLRQRITDEPGAIFEYNPVAGKVPESIPVPGLPGYVFDQLQDIGARLKDTFGLNEVVEGGLPPNVEAGVAIDLLQEAATDRLAPQIMMMEKTLERCGNLMLQLAQQYYTEPRTMIITGSGSKPKIKRFEDADLIKGVSIKVEAGSGLPRTRAGRQARVMQLLQMGILSPTKAYKYMDMADFKGLQMQFEADEEQAMREHERLLEGGIINEEAARQAQEQLMMSMMEAPGEPIDPPLLQQSVEAGLQPLAFENKAVHMETHAQFMKSAEFESMPLEIKQQFYKHFEFTQQAMSEESSSEGTPPRVSLQLRGTVGPTTGSKILSNSGIPGVTPEEMLEPPLETVVFDNLDKPNADNDVGSARDEQQMRFLQELQEQQAKADQELANKEREEVMRGG
jgi:hypothetical protein